MNINSGPELDRVCSTVLSWHRYAPEVKADLFSTLVVSPAGAYAVDPITIDAACLRKTLAPGTIAGVIVTNENHVRAAVEFAEEFDVAIFAHDDARAALNLPAATALFDGAEFANGLTAIAIDGAPAGEIAIYADADGGSLIVGDALINMSAYGFTFLPPKYCSNQKRMRKSLRKLLDREFQRILFAHGLPLVTHAKRQLTELLETGA